MTLREFVNILRSRWRVIVLCTLFVTALAAAFTAAQTPVYTATAKVYFLVNSNGASKNSGGYLLTQADLDTFAEILSAPSVVEPLRKELDLPAGAPVNVSAAISSSSTMMTFTAQDSDPTLAADMANAAGPVLAQVAPEFSQLLKASGQSIEARPVAPAQVPGTPSSPNVPRNVLLGLLAGLVLGISVAMMRNSLDTKVRSDDDVKAISDRPLLARLPLVKRARGNWMSMVDDPHGAHAEAIRRLRANMMFVDVATRRHSFAVTSSLPGEGKTTTVVNLAHATSDSGLKTLLVDADLRNPSVAQRMGLEGELGLTTVLLGAAQPGDVIQRIGQTNLYVMTAGEIPPNPSELLGSEPMQQLFERLTSEFDFVLVDTPPVIPVVDASLIQRFTGGLIMVVGAGRTRKRDLTSAVRQLETAGARIAGFAFNKDSAATSGNYYYGRYGRYGRTPEGTEATHAAGSENPAALASSLGESRRDRKGSEPRRSLLRR